DVRLEDVVELDPLVVEEAVRSRQFVISAASRGDAGRGMFPQLCEEVTEPLVQALIVQIDGLHLLNHPWSQHNSLLSSTYPPGSPFLSVRKFPQWVRRKEATCVVQRGWQARGSRPHRARVSQPRRGDRSPVASPGTVAPAGLRSPSPRPGPRPVPGGYHP